MRKYFVVAILCAVCFVSAFSQEYLNYKVSGAYTIGSDPILDLSSYPVYSIPLIPMGTTYNLIAALDKTHLYLFKDCDGSTINTGPIATADFSGLGTGIEANTFTQDKLYYNSNEVGPYYIIGTNLGIICYKVDFSTTPYSLVLCNIGTSILFDPYQTGISDPPHHRIIPFHNVSFVAVSKLNFAYQYLEIVGSGEYRHDYYDISLTDATHITVTYNDYFTDDEEYAYPMNGIIGETCNFDFSDHLQRPSHYGHTYNRVKYNGPYNDGIWRETFGQGRPPDKGSVLLTKGFESNWRAGSNTSNQDYTQDLIFTSGSRTYQSPFGTIDGNQVDVVNAHTVHEPGQDGAYIYNGYLVPTGDVVHGIGYYQYRISTNRPPTYEINKYYLDNCFSLALGNDGLKVVRFANKRPFYGTFIQIPASVVGYNQQYECSDLTKITVAENPHRGYLYVINHSVLEGSHYQLVRIVKSSADIAWPNYPTVDAIHHLSQGGTYPILWSTNSDQIYDTTNVSLEVNYNYPNGSWESLASNVDIKHGELDEGIRPQVFVNFTGSGNHVRIRMRSTDDSCLYSTMIDTDLVVEPSSSPDPSPAFSSGQIIDNYCCISRPRTINSGDSLTIAPGATVMFVDSGKIIVPNGTKLIFQTDSNYIKQYSKMIDANQTAYTSSAIDVQSGGAVVGKHVDFYNLLTAIQSTNGKVILDSAEFVNCVTAVNITSLTDSIKLTNSTFNGSTTQIQSANGNGSPLTLSNCTFNVVGTNEPTVIYSDGGAKLTIDNCNISSTESSVFGGLFSSYDTSVTVTNTTVTSQLGYNSGIWAVYANDMYVENVTGSGFYYGITCSHPNGDMEFLSNNLTSCHVGYYIGQLVNDQLLSYCNADNCDIGTYLVSGQPELSNCQMTNGSQYGCIFFTGYPTIKGSLLNNNDVGICQYGSSQTTYFGPSSQVSNSTSAEMQVSNYIYPLGDYSHFDFENTSGSASVPFISNSHKNYQKVTAYLRGNYWYPVVNGSNYTKLFPGSDSGAVVVDPQDVTGNYTLDETLDAEDVLYLDAVQHDTSGAWSTANQEYRNYLSLYADSISAPVVVNRLCQLDLKRNVDLSNSRAYFDSLASQFTHVRWDAKVVAMRCSRDLGEFSDASSRLASLYSLAQNRSDTLFLQLEELDLYQAIAFFRNQSGTGKQNLSTHTGFASLSSIPGGMVAAPQSSKEYRRLLGQKISEFTQQLRGTLPKNANTFAALPNSFALHNAYPNPFNPTTTISFELPKTSPVKIVIYDALGRLVTTLVSSQLREAGHYEVKWNAQPYASGVYFCRMEAGTFTATKKLMLLK